MHGLGAGLVSAGNNLVVLIARHHDCRELGPVVALLAEPGGHRVWKLRLEERSIDNLLAADDIRLLVPGLDVALVLCKAARIGLEVGEDPANTPQPELAALQQEQAALPPLTRPSLPAPPQAPVATFAADVPR